jgi:hypothetical protein
MLIVIALALLPALGAVVVWGLVCLSTLGRAAIADHEGRAPLD